MAGGCPPQSRAGLAGEVLEDALVRVVVAVVVVGQDARVVGALHVPAQRLAGALWGWQSVEWVETPCTLPSPHPPSKACPQETPQGHPTPCNPGAAPVLQSEVTKQGATLSLALGTMSLPSGVDTALALSLQSPRQPTPPWGYLVLELLQSQRGNAARGLLQGWFGAAQDPAHLVPDHLGADEGSALDPHAGNTPVCGHPSLHRPAPRSPACPGDTGLAAGTAPLPTTLPVLSFPRDAGGPILLPLPPAGSTPIWGL